MIEGNHALGMGSLYPSWLRRHFIGGAQASNVMAAREQGIILLATRPSVERFLGAWSQSCVCVLTIWQGRVQAGFFVVIKFVRTEL